MFSCAAKWQKHRCCTLETISCGRGHTRRYIPAFAGSGATAVLLAKKAKNQVCLVLWLVEDKVYRVSHFDSQEWPLF
jgi:hypothetical protein